jgi:hypothetical protein
MTDWSVIFIRIEKLAIIMSLKLLATSIEDYKLEMKEEEQDEERMEYGFPNRLEGC